MELIFRKYRREDFEELAKMVLGLYSKDGTKATQMATDAGGTPVPVVPAP